MITKKQLEEQPISPMKQQYSYTRYKDGQLVPQGAIGYWPPRLKKEYIPGQGYVPKMRRK